MRSVFKRAFSAFLIPLTRWYLRKERKYSWRGIDVVVPPGVFHPGLFHSTHFLLEHLATRKIQGHSLLELGCGTGMISIYAAGQGARVTASDLSEKAIAAVTANSTANRTPIRIVHSDLFAAIPKEAFDFIIINPPYYAKAVSREADLAWHCGEDFEYFRRLFAVLGDYIHLKSEVIMVLTKGCDLDRIFEIAKEHQFNLKMIDRRPAIFDGEDYLYVLESV